VTRGQLPQRAGSLGLTAVGLPPRYPRVVDETAKVLVLQVVSCNNDVGLEIERKHVVRQLSAAAV